MNDNIVTEETFIDFTCPHCGEEVSFPAGCAGLVRDCFSCQEPLVVPQTGGEAAPIPLPVTSERLVLRRFKGPDWRNLLAMVSEQDFLGSPFFGDTEESVTRWLEADTVVKLTTPGSIFTLAIETVEGGQIIGYLSFKFDAEMLEADFYVVVRGTFQKKGYGTEAVKAALGFCFDGLSLHRVEATCESTNAGACRLLQKAGLRREGEFVKDHKGAGGEWANTASYAILREEWTTPAAQ
jgi:ribosomal-protein-alanine N-acetyltransferase